MNIDELRLKVQRDLKAARGVTDVAFTPLSHDVEMVSFYEAGVRAHFALVMPFVDVMPLVSLISMAGAAFDAAKVKAAEEAAKRAEDARAQVRVLA